MITTCTKCGKLYEAGSEEQANEPGRLCLSCIRGETSGASLANAVCEPLKEACE